MNPNKLWQLVLILLVNWGDLSRLLAGVLTFVGRDMKAEGPASSRGRGDPGRGRRRRETQGALWGECPASSSERPDPPFRPLRGQGTAREAS